MRWNLIFAAVLTLGLCNCGHGFELLNRMLGTSKHYDGCKAGYGGAACKYDALAAKYDCGCPQPQPCDCGPPPRSYRCFKICIPRITLPCPKVFCSTECYTPKYVGCGCGGACHGYHYGGYGGYGPASGPAASPHYPAAPIPSDVDSLPEPVDPPIVEPSAYYAPRRTASRPEALWNW